MAWRRFYGNKGGNCLLDAVSEGQEIKVFFDIRGREYNGKYFNNLVGWKIEGFGEAVVTSGDAKEDRPKLPEEPKENGEADRGYPSSWDDNNGDGDTPF